jgi:hypothetical protein
MIHHRLILLRRKNITRVTHPFKRFVGGAIALRGSKPSSTPNMDRQQQNKVLSIEPQKKLLRLKL